MQEEQYIWAQSPEEIEEQRLGILESIRDSGTIRRMKELGVCPGWRCLEVGAGRGSIARWLAEQVGSTGHVVATDIDLRFLERIRASNLEVRLHNVCEEDFERSAYDLVHCRALLIHVPRPEEALARMAKAVRSVGGGSSSRRVITGALARLILPILGLRSSTAQLASSGISHKQRGSCDLTSAGDSRAS